MEVPQAESEAYLFQMYGHVSKTRHGDGHLVRCYINAYLGNRLVIGQWPYTRGVMYSTDLLRLDQCNSYN